MVLKANQLTDVQLREMLTERNVPVGLIDGATRQRYQNRLQKLLDSEFKKPNAVPQAKGSPAVAASRASTRQSRGTPGPAAAAAAAAAATSAIQQHRTPPPAPVVSFSSDEADLSQSEDRPTGATSLRQRRRHTPAVPRTSALPTPKPAAAAPSANRRSATPTVQVQRRSRGRKSAALNTSTSLLLQDDSESDAPDNAAASALSTNVSVGRLRRDDRLDVSDGEEPPRLATSTARVGNGRADAFPSTGAPFTNYSALIPNLMLVIAIVLGLFIGAIFIIEQSRLAKARQMEELQRIVCSPDQLEMKSGPDAKVANCIQGQSGLLQAVKLARPLHDQLARMRGDAECFSTGRDYRLPRGSIEKLLTQSVHGLTVTKEDVDNVIRLAIRAPQLGIQVLMSDADNAAPAASVEKCFYLAAADGRRSVYCRFRLLVWSALASLVRLAAALAYVALGLACLAGLVCLAVYVARQRRRREAALVDATEQVLVHLLNTEAGVPLDEVRAELQRSGVFDSGLVNWDQLRARIAARERRILVEESIRGGEVWRLRAGEAEALRARGLGANNVGGTAGGVGGSGGGARAARGWQGSVLADSGHSMPHIEPPTQCLKLRGMWSPDNGQCDKDRLVTELRSKAPPGSLLHADCVAMGGEGFVYALFKTRKSAGLTRNAVHAHFFDGTLVTARYMTLDKYCQRFPDNADEFKTALSVN